jgi:hypothetical protein
MNEHTKARLWLITALIFVVALLRLLPHPPNFTPLGAVALFAGARLGWRYLAFLIPLGALFFSDLLLELTTGWGFHSTLPFVYLAFALAVGVGIMIRRAGISVGSVAGGAVGASVIFYLVSNFAVWATTGMYPLNWQGLVACYVAAIPFFGNTLAGDLFFSAPIFGSFAIAERRVPLFAPVAEG